MSQSRVASYKLEGFFLIFCYFHVPLIFILLNFEGLNYRF